MVNRAYEANRGSLMPRAHTYLLTLVVAALACTSSTSPELFGTWGGNDASMVLGLDGGTITYLCGSGTIDAGWRFLPGGTFSATGNHYYGGGPVPSQGRTPHPATYVGHVQGKVMTLSVTITDQDTILGPYTLVKGGPAVSEICV